MKSEQILDVMRDYVNSEPSIESPDKLEECKVVEVLETSFDVVEFTMHLEERLGLDEDTLDLATWGEKMADATFGELAVQVEQFLQEQAS
jgi:hypothetical protein